MLDEMLDEAAFESEPRFNQWVNASKGSIHYEPFMQRFIRGLGWLDVELIGLDDKYNREYCSDPANQKWILPAARILMFKIHHLSELWVMGGWELIRTIDDRFHKRQQVADQYSNGAKVQVRQTKKAFRVLRIPLAKFEPLGVEGESSQTATGVIPYTKREMRWVTEKDKIIYRRDLADSLLETLTVLVKEMPHHKRPIIAHNWVKSS